MKIFLMALALLGIDSSPVDRGEGVLEVLFEPRICVKSPCPQFKVSTVNGSSVDGLSADIVNLDTTKSAVGAFRKVRVKATWKWAEVNGAPSKDLIEVRFSEWEVLVKEKAQEDLSVGK